MAPFEECSVLLPSATLEDFPTGGSDQDARSLLAGWTVLWHPQLLAQTEQMPTWYRADSPPNPDGARVFVVPHPSVSQVPTDFRRKCEASANCKWITGSDRDEMLNALGLDGHDESMRPMEYLGRSIGVEDFFAAGYLMLQIQIMTRRLRYTSNLDELYLQSRATEAAKAFQGRDPEKTAEALHDVFDSLSEERDHYFSSDPALIDLTLLTPSVLDASFNDGWLERLAQHATADDDSAGIRGTPRNVLIDGTVARHLCASTDATDGAPEKTGEAFQKLQSLLGTPTIGWAGGGAAPEDHSHCLDAMTMASARHEFEAGTELAERAIGKRPSVYARLSGMTPVDLIPALAAQGFNGVIPIDFAGGTGFGDEAKVIISGGGAELEALTSKPIDAASDASFLSIGSHLGEAIDSGEVATALLVHWPDRVCDSFNDFCRAATWSLALGKFWTLDDYFTEGERPYHHGNLDAVSASSADMIARSISAADSDETLQSMAGEFGDLVCQETYRTTVAVAALARPALANETATGSVDKAYARNQVLAALGVPESGAGVCDAESTGTSTAFCFNPHGVASRRQGALGGGSPGKQPFVYASTDGGNNRCDVTFDVPALGFTELHATESVKKTGILKRLTGSGKGIAESGMLRNEFMAVSLDESTGGIAGVYSASRGNRLSMRLVAADALSGEREGGRMVCRGLKTTVSNLTRGIVAVEGELRNSEDVVIATFELKYQLDRGSRRLEIEGSLRPTSETLIESASDVWKKYFAMRTAVAGEASIIRALVRDKVHSTTTRRIVSPLGVLIDEAEKQTLVAGHGLPLHRKVGDRFVDTLIAHPDVVGRESPHAQAETTRRFELTIAFDAPGPVAVARSCISPPEVLSISPSGSDEAKSSATSQQAWLIHVSAGDVLITEMSTAKRADGKLAVAMQLVRTRPKSSNVRLQFCVPAEAAFVSGNEGINRSLDDLPTNVICENGAVELTLGQHEVMDLIVVFEV